MTSKKVLLGRLGRMLVRELREATKQYHFGRLREGYRYRVRPDNRAPRLTVYSAYYWAGFAAAGRHAIRNKLVAFFPDLDDDPRVATRYPRQPGDAVSLLDVASKDEIRQWRKEGKLVFTRNVGPAPAKRFLQLGIASARRKVSLEASKFLKAEIRGIINIRGIRRLSIRVG